MSQRITREQAIAYAHVLKWDEDGPRLRAERNALIEDNLAVVRRMLPKYINRGVDEEDLVQEGRLGLLRAAEGFDPGRGVPFTAHARYWVREFLRMAVINRAHAVRVPLQTIRKHTRLEQFRAEHFCVHGRQPTPEEVASVLGYSLETQKTIEACRPAIGTESIEHDHLVEDLDDDVASADEIVRMRRLQRAVAKLPDDQREVVERCFNLDRRGAASIRQVARELRKPARVVEELRDAAIESLRDVMR